MATSADSTSSLPLDVLRRVAELVAGGDGRKRTIILEIQNCSLVNLAFASAFQPHLFYRAYVSGTSEARMQKRLDILTFSPHLAAYVKHLTLTMSDGQSSFALSPLLDCFTSLRSLSLAFFSWTTPWQEFTPSFRTSVERLCDLPSLEALNLYQVNGVPASLLMANRNLTSISISGSAPAFSSLPTEEDVAMGQPVPLSLNITNVNLTKVDLNEAFNRAIQFFSRVVSLHGTASWRPEKNAAFNTFVTLLSRVSRLQHLDVTTDCEYMDDSSVPPHHLLHSLDHVKSLKSLTLSTRQTPTVYRHRFLSALHHAIASLDTTSLQRLSINILGQRYGHLSTLCGPQGLGSTAPDSLDGALAAKLKDGRLEKLEGVLITIQIDRSEFNHRLEGPRLWVREATFLPSLPAEKVWVVLKPMFGDVMYDSRQSD